MKHSLLSKQIKISLSNGELFEKAQISGFKSDLSLLSLVLEQKKLVLKDDVDAVAIDIFSSNFVKLAQKKWSENACNKNMERKFAKWLLTYADVPDLNPKEPTSKPTSAQTTSRPTP